MKKFNELSYEQQNAAVDHFLKKLKGHMITGLITYPNKTPESILVADASIAAECALYEEPSDYVVTGLMGLV